MQNIINADFNNYDFASRDIQSITLKSVCYAVAVKVADQSVTVLEKTVTHYCFVDNGNVIFTGFNKSL